MQPGYVDSIAHEYERLKVAVVGLWRQCDIEAVACLKYFLATYVGREAVSADTLEGALAAVQEVGLLSVNNVHALVHASDVAGCWDALELVHRFESRHGLGVLHPSDSVARGYDRESPGSPMWPGGGPWSAAALRTETARRRSADAVDRCTDAGLRPVTTLPPSAGASSEASWSARHLSVQAVLDRPVSAVPDVQAQHRYLLVEFLAERLGPRYLQLGAALPQLSRHELAALHCDTAASLVESARALLLMYMSRAGQLDVERDLVDRLAACGWHRLCQQLRLWLHDRAPAGGVSRVVPETERAPRTASPHKPCIQLQMSPRPGFPNMFSGVNHDEKHWSRKVGDWEMGPKAAVFPIHKSEGSVFSGRTAAHSPECSSDQQQVQWAQETPDWCQSLLGHNMEKLKMGNTSHVPRCFACC